MALAAAEASPVGHGSRTTRTGGGRARRGSRYARSDVELLSRRLCSGFGIVIGACVVFLVIDLLFGKASVAVLVLVKTVQIALLGSGILVLRSEGDLDRLRWRGVAVVCAIYATSAVSAILRDELIATSFLFVATMLGTAAFVPWGPRAQLATAAVAVLSLGIARVVVGLEPGPELAYRAMVIVLAALGSVWIARENERQRRERRRADRQLATESRVSAALARAGEEMIACERMPEILDRVCSITAELLDCDHTDLVLREDDVYVPRSFHGHPPADWPEITSLRIPAALLEPVVALLRGGGVVQMKTSELPDAFLQSLHARFGTTANLYVPLRRGGDVIGILSAHYRGGSGRFGGAQERIAAGIGYLASMALENAHLFEELREASRLKSEFVSTMSHELRTPVSVILGYADMLDDEPDADKRTAILQRIRGSGLELLDLIEETLNLSRLEAGKDPPRLERVEVAGLFSELVAEFGAVSRLDAVAVRWEGPRHLEVTTDRRKLRIILKNLLGNALKFTPRGEVVVACEVDDARVHVVVRDTGIGIAPEHLPIIFDMFRQADSSDARAYRGAGLGLHIVKRLVHQLGGEIRVASEPGRGSAFTFTLPQETSAPSFPSPPSSSPPP